jgi:oxygen-independent coproporphyrinogen-3 oxidase
MWGISADEVEEKFGLKYKKYLMEQAKPYLEKELMNMENRNLHISEKGKFLGDGISSDLFFVNSDTEKSK